MRTVFGGAYTDGFAIKNNWKIKIESKTEISKFEVEIPLVKKVLFTNFQK